MQHEQEELLDVLDAQALPTGVTKSRGEVHRDGDWHRAFHLWIVKDDTFVLLQRRANTKDLEPGKVDVSVGGHYRAGETLLDVVREVEEEIGLAVRPGELHFLLEQRSERSYETATDREFQEVYALRNDQPLDHYAPRCDEVFVLYEIPIDRAIELFRDGTFVPVAGYDCMARNNNALLIEDDLIAQAREATVRSLEAVRAWLRQDADPNED